MLLLEYEWVGCQWCRAQSRGGRFINKWKRTGPSLKFWEYEWVGYQPLALLPSLPQGIVSKSEVERWRCGTQAHLLPLPSAAGQYRPSLPHCPTPHTATLRPVTQGKKDAKAKGKGKDGAPEPPPVPEGLLPEQPGWEAAAVLLSTLQVSAPISNPWLFLCIGDGSHNR